LESAVILRTVALHSASIHEAGHAVAARVFKIPVTCVELSPEPRILGRMRFRGGERELSLIEHAVIAFAGYAAEHLAWVTEAEALAGTAMDFKDVTALLAATSDRGGARAFVEARTFELLRANWPDVLLLAVHLEKRRALSSADLEPLGFYWPPAESSEIEPEWLRID
jgi:hypothetical protein